MKATDWYWSDGVNEESGWLHGGVCYLQAALRGYPLEPELEADRWEPARCIICNRKEPESE